MESTDLPIFNVPEGKLGPTKRHRHQDILVGCQGKTHAVGWILFGKDGSLYFHRRGQSPVTEIGMAVKEEGKLVTTQAMDISTLPLEARVGTHLSLHPSGQVHVKSGRGNKLCVGSIGAWLPVLKAFTFAHVFTEPIRSLPEVDQGTKAAPALPVTDPASSLRLDIIVAPLNIKDGKAHVPFTIPPTIFFGLSPRYAVLVHAAPSPPCESCIFFLSQS